MKRPLTIVLYVVTILIAVAFLTGCAPEKEDNVSIGDRINGFVSDLNNNYANVYKNWHPDSTTRQAAANPTALETKFPQGESGTYEISNIDDGETATATLNSGTTYTNESVTFRMRKDDGDWFINSLDIDGITLSSVE